MIILGDIHFPNKMGEITCYVVAKTWKVIMFDCTTEEQAEAKAKEEADRRGCDYIIPATSKFPVIIKE